MSVEPKRYAEIRVLAGKLMASCDGGRDEQEEIESLTLEECKVLDTMVLECACCGHWFIAKTMHDCGHEYRCDDCNETNP